MTQEETLEAIEHGYSKWAKITFIILAFLVLVVIIEGVVNYYLINQNRNRSNEIQEQRYDASLNACEMQNIRHDNTIAILDDRFALIKQSATPSQKITIEQSKTFTILLIEALAPHRDCKVVAAASLKTRP